ncbi:histidine kinase dimerization/phosphoacceptor domain-containing protein, partial [Streptomyces sp. SBT349]|uniref:histidine kinase dimerization/phosphoacceptor domain-containing protein n=1 Tax=Streptomyces sp. SBT349 TaxID=1580539 RepID=UPI00066C2594
MTADTTGQGRGGGPPWQRWQGWQRRLAAQPPAARLPWLSSGAVLFFQFVGSHFAAVNQPDRAALDPFARTLLIVGPLLLLLRRRHPAQVALATSAIVLLYLATGYPYGPAFLSVVVGAFSAVVAGHRRAAWAAMGLLWGGHLLVGHLLYRWLPPSGDPPQDWSADGGLAAWAVAVLAVSELLRVRRETLAGERAAREEAERRRADEERLRIARELHDVLAHSISVINVQAGMGLALLDSDPEQARTALTTIKAASKEALGEVRQVLDTLRTPGSAPRA